MIDIKELRLLVQDFKLAGSPMFLQTTQMNELLDRLEAAEKERDDLRSLVVMRFDHDHPPQFVQGYSPHELNEPVTAEHCRWFVAEIEQLRAKIERMEKRLRLILEEPENTMSNSKAMREMLRQARLALDGTK